MDNLYDTDVIAWSRQQAALLRCGRFAEIDLVNIIDEIESVGRAEERDFTERLSELLLELMKWHYQPGFRCIGWNTVISLKRKQVHLCLEETPSLRASLSDSHCLQSAWDDAYVFVINELGVDAPDQPIWTAQQILNPNFLPD